MKKFFLSILLIFTFALALFAMPEQNISVEKTKSVKVQTATETAVFAVINTKEPIFRWQKAITAMATVKPNINKILIFENKIAFAKIDYPLIN